MVLRGGVGVRCGEYHATEDCPYPPATSAAMRADRPYQDMDVLERVDVLERAVDRLALRLQSALSLSPQPAMTSVPAAVQPMMMMHPGGADNVFRPVYLLPAASNGGQGNGQEDTHH